MKKNLKLLIFLAVQFSLVISICLIVLFEGKKNYTVTFNLNGGNCISGEVVQSVKYGEAATPPIVTRNGCYLVGWSAPYHSITSDVEIYAIWDWQTTAGIEFEEKGNYYLVSGCFDDISGEVYIAPYYNGKRVLGIKDEAFKDCKNVTAVYLIDGLISIGDNAFNGCTSLKTMHIPSTVEKIGKNILKGCDNLEGLITPFIGNSIFDNTTPYLGYFFGGTGYLNGYKYVPSTLGVVNIVSKLSIPEYAFYKCSNIINVNIFAEVEYIGANAFRNCSGMTQIIMPNTIKSIGKAAFANCSSLFNMELPPLIETLQDGVLANCTALESLTIGSSMKNISPNALQNCTKLKNFTINNNENFVTENDKLFIVKDGKKEEYKITTEKYTDETDLLIEAFPIIRPGLFPTISEDKIAIDKDIIIKIEDEKAQ